MSTNRVYWGKVVLERSRSVDFREAHSHFNIKRKLREPPNNQELSYRSFGSRTTYRSEGLKLILQAAFLPGVGIG